MLTPRDIETKEFSHGKGYKAEEVEAFLDEILVDYTALIEERDNLSRRVLALSEKLENFRDEQEEWKQTLLHTQKSYDEVMQLAKENSAKMIAEAEKEAAKIKEDAVKAANEATAEADKQRAEKNALSDEIANFKSKMLSIYEEHIKNLNNLPQIAKESLAGVRIASLSRLFRKNLSLFRLRRLRQRKQRSSRQLQKLQMCLRLLRGQKSIRRWTLSGMIMTMKMMTIF